MKIRDRLTLTLSLTVFAAVASLGVFIYYFTVKFHEREFFSRLEERVQFTELMYIEKDARLTQTVREKFMQKLDDEHEYVITMGRSGVDSLDAIRKGLADDILTDEYVRFWLGKHQVVAKMYDLPDGKYAVVVKAEDVFGKSKQRNLRGILLAGVLLCSLILVAVSWFTTSRELKPLETQILKARRISADQLDLRLEVKDPQNEIGLMTIAFNNMLDRLQASFEAQKQFVRNASHEMRNPLTAIIGEAELLLEKERTPKEYKEALITITAEAERLSLLTQQLLALEKAESLAALPQPETESLHLCLLEVLEKFPAQRIKLHVDDHRTDWDIQANRHLLFTAVFNIVDNALKYSGEKTVKISLIENGDLFVLKVRDEGVGIPAQDLPNIYQPMHRARNVRNTKGHGIGLPLAKKIITLHGGSIEVKSEEGHWTDVEVKLPGKERW